MSSVGEKDYRVTADQKQRWIGHRFKEAVLRKLDQCGKEIRFINGKRKRKRMQSATALSLDEQGAFLSANLHPRSSHDHHVSGRPPTIRLDFLFCNKMIKTKVFTLFCLQHAVAALWTPISGAKSLSERSSREQLPGMSHRASRASRASSQISNDKRQQRVPMKESSEQQTRKRFREKPFRASSALPDLSSSSSVPPPNDLISSAHVCTGGNQAWSGAKLQDLPHKFGFPSTTGKAQFRVCYLENVCWQAGALHYFEGVEGADAKGSDSDLKPPPAESTYGLRSLASDGGGLVKLGYLGPLWTPEIHRGFLPTGASFFSEKNRRERLSGAVERYQGTTKELGRIRQDRDLIHTLFDFSWEDNIGHYLFDNLLPTWIALDAFGLTDEWRSVVPTAYSDCALLGGVKTPYVEGVKTKRDESGNGSGDGGNGMGESLTRQLACLSLVSSMTDAFFAHPLLVLPQKFAASQKGVSAANATTCFRRMLVGQNSAFSIQSLKLDLGGHVRRLREHALRLHPSSRFNERHRKLLVKRLADSSGSSTVVASSSPSVFASRGARTETPKRSTLFPDAPLFQQEPTQSTKGYIELTSPEVVHILVAERGAGFTAGAWENVCTVVQELVQQRQEQRQEQRHLHPHQIQETNSVLVSCITPASMSFSEELRWMQEADIFVSEDGTTSLAAVWSRDFTVSVVLGRGDGESSPLWKEDQHMLYMTHIVPLFVRLGDGTGLGEAIAHAMRVRTKHLSRSVGRLHSG